MAETTGGMSHQTLGSVLVTPSGEVVGSAFVGGKGGGGTSQAEAWFWQSFCK